MSSRLIVSAGAMALALVSIAIPLRGQSTIIFRPDYSQGAFPQAGWGRAIDEKFGVRWTRSFLPTGGPFGGPAHRLTELPRPNDAECGGQHGWGWDRNIETSDPPRGAAGKRYYRWAMRFTSASNFRSSSPPSCEPAMASDKLFIVGQGCGSRNCRVILTHKVQPSDRRAQFTLAIDGGVHQTETGYIVDTSGWLFLQLELTPSTSTSTTDGGWRLFINNNTTPALTRTGIRLDPENWKYIAFGAYNNNTLLAGGTHEFDTALFEAATTFDSNWYRTGSSGPVPPPPPTQPSQVQGVRVIAP